VTDVSHAEDCRRAVDQVLAAFGTIDILINCAGVSMGPAANNKQGRVKFFEADPEGWQRVVSINALGAFLMARFAVAPMVAKGWGRIINVTTSYDTMLAEGLSAYGASKSALEASTVSWSKDLAGTGVTVNVLVPGGPVETPGFFPPGAPRPPRILQADVMAVPIVWLASPQSDGVTGCRFIARDWDQQLPAAEAANKCRTLAAWSELAAAATKARGVAI
jgi:3-oxoacyl-[acyl-carrier protein] reductase